MTTTPITTYTDESLFFQKVDRILSGMPTISVQQGSRTGSDIAFTNTGTKEIFLNFPKINEIETDTTKFIGLCKGFNYHELAHILYTRRSAKMKWSGNLLQISNALEDGKIERLFSEEYPKAKKYFENCVLRVLWNERADLSPLMFLAIYSRGELLPPNIINYFEKSFAKAYTIEVTEKVKVLINKYIRETDIDKQYDIVQDIANLLGEDLDLANEQNFGRLVCEILTSACKSMPKALQEKLKNLQAHKSQLSEAERKEVEKVAKEIQALRDKIKELEKELDKTEQKLWNDENLTQTQKQRLKDKIKELEKQIENLQKQLKQMLMQNPSELSPILTQGIGLIEVSIDTEVQNDLRTIYGGGCGSESGSELQTTPFMVTPKHKELANKLKNIVKIIKNDLKQGYIPNRKAGKINLRKSMNWKSTGNTRIFKKYIPSKLDKSRLGVIALLDSSGSMGDKDFNDALACSWILCEALEKVGNKVALIEYSTNYKIIKGFDKKGDFRRHFSDGTTPLRAITTATELIEEQKAKNGIKNWLLFILTDGCWEQPAECDALLSTISKSKEVDTIMIHFGHDTPEAHKCNHTIKINDMDKLAEIFKSVVKKVQRNIIIRLAKEN